MKLEYTPAFFKKLEAMIDKRPHTWKGCGVVDGEYRRNKDGSRQRFQAIVRLCVDDPSQPKNVSWNIAMFCTKCRKPNQEWRTPRRIKPQNMPQLFSEAK